mmetsp:Transcript_8162/g.16476  ORF Transcript_8162/g.16476 Transcript_8162/m.16476 type:complete len:248 (-) Transcript_8162:18-761(-)
MMVKKYEEEGGGGEGVVMKEGGNKNSYRGKTPESYKFGKGAKATTSDRPGETREITFYRITSDGMVEGEGGGNVKGVTIVDMPGYGFAYVNKKEEDRYRKMAEEYLTQPRDGILKHLYLLIDGRHGLKKQDKTFLLGLEEIYLNSKRSKTNPPLRFPPITIILTKCDLCKRVDLARRISLVKSSISSIFTREYTPGGIKVMACSAKPGVGFNNVKGKDRRPNGGIIEIQKDIARVIKGGGRETGTGI